MGGTWGAWENPIAGWGHLPLAASLQSLVCRLHDTTALGSRKGVLKVVCPSQADFAGVAMMGAVGTRALEAGGAGVLGRPPPWTPGSQAWRQQEH